MYVCMYPKLDDLNRSIQKRLLLHRYPRLIRSPYFRQEDPFFRGNGINFEIMYEVICSGFNRREKP